MKGQRFIHPFGGLHREFHVSREARDRYGVEDAVVSIRGTVVVAEHRVAQRLADAMNAVRDVRRFPESAVRAGDLYAAGLLDEILHLVLQAYRQQVDPEVVTRAERAVRDAVGDGDLREVMEQFTDRFPTVAVARGETTAAQHLDAATEGVPNREIALEELLMLHLATRNPAMERFAELFDDTPMTAHRAYLPAVEALRAALEQQPALRAGQDGAVGPSPEGTLLDLLEGPMRASPTSLEGQLGYVRERWGALLGPRFAALLDRIVRSLDVLREEGRPRGFAGPGPSVVPDERSLRGQGPAEYEAFSSDESWMPRLVMLAKATYVWLDQLSKRYGRDIRRLDQIPDEVLDEMAERGFTGLWLIGLWERSTASRRIKHLRGQEDAVASAYALYDYAIADDLGGDAAYAGLRDRAWRRGIRLASDMVPNHVGIDGKWVMEHPEWFVQVDHPPYPGYTFRGPDLSTDGRAAVYLEDHYYDSSDAAVVFKRVDRGSGEERFIYHGNDGTSMPWNDTAQLDYLNPDVREAVIQTILHVARKFPIIRFDAAMTLAKQHIQRLWYPEPGKGGAIPSRSQYGSMPAGRFEERIPQEFWREVVDRVAHEVPGTLLLAEAFWMMEGYFVRTLGMHRVYNSAFMNMFKREENAEYRRLIKNTLEFDPEILKRFVNFMNNPDEETAVAQFGRDDKYFGTAIVMCTMPGLPMFGHGQVEGFTEKYGMEYRRARLDERPDEALVARHRREVFPLLHRREQFAHVENFRLYDVRSEHGVVEDVFAYSNRHQGRASLVFYNNRFDRATGWIDRSSPFVVKDGDRKELRAESLAEALGLEGGADRFVVLRDAIAGNERLSKSDDLHDRGLYVELGAFKYQVYTDLREVVDADGTYAALHASLGSGAVPSVDEARRDLQLAGVHETFRRLVRTSGAARPELARAEGNGAPAADSFRQGYGDRMTGDGTSAAGAGARGRGSVENDTAEKAAIGKGAAEKGAIEKGAAERDAATSETAAAPDDAGDAFTAFVAEGRRHADVGLRPRAEERFREGLARLTSGTWRRAAGNDPLPAGILLAALVAMEPLAAPAEAIEVLRLDRALAAELVAAERIGADEAWAQSRLFAAVAGVLTDLALGPLHADRIVRTLAATEPGRQALGVHLHDGVAWFGRERYRALTSVLVAVSAWARPTEADAVARFAARLEELESASGYRFDRLAGARPSGGVGAEAERPGEAAPPEPRSTEPGDPT